MERGLSEVTIISHEMLGRGNEVIHRQLSRPSRLNISFGNMLIHTIGDDCGHSFVMSNFDKFLVSSEI